MKKFTNPNFIYIGTFIFPFLVYSLEWSTIYPALTPQLFGFYLLTFLIAFLLGLLINKLRAFTYKPIPVFPYNLLVIIGLYFFYWLDCLYAGYVPLFAFSTGEAEYGGNINFGIPTFHVLLVTFNLFFAVFLFHQLLSNRKKSLFLLYISAFVPFIFLLQRSNIMITVISSVFMFFIAQKRISAIKISGLVVLMVAAIYLFGFLGNLRSGNGDPTFIPRVSGATEEFLESWVPKEFYWGYLYIASPVANLQNNINIEQNVHPDYAGFIVFEMIPDFVSKKIANILSLTRREFNQINSFLNVGTLYARPFSFLSWMGMLILFIYMLVLMNLYYLIMQKSSRYGATGISLMFTMIALANFDNTISYSAFSFPLFYPFLFSVIKGFKIKKTEKINPELSVNLSVSSIAKQP